MTKMRRTIRVINGCGNVNLFSVVPSHILLFLTTHRGKTQSVLHEKWGDSLWLTTRERRRKEMAKIKKRHPSLLSRKKEETFDFFFIYY
jgi:hypothetical protein